MFSEKMIKNLISMIVTIAIVVVLTFIGYHSLMQKPKPNTVNPYEFNIDEYRVVPDSLIGYTEFKSIPVPLLKLHALAVDSLNNIYVSGDNELFVYKNEKLIQKISVPASITCLAVNNDTIYTGFSNYMSLMDTTGKTLDQWDAFNGNSILTSIAVHHNHVFVADAGNQIVLHYNNQGILINTIGKKDESKDIPGFIIPSPYFDCAVDPDGFLWVANPGRLSLENYSFNGDFRSQWGIGGIAIKEFSGCCNPAHFAITSEGNFITGEKGLERIKEYNRVGELVTVVAPSTAFKQGTSGIDIAVGNNNVIYVLDPERKLIRLFRKES